MRLAREFICKTFKSQVLPHSRSPFSLTLRPPSGKTRPTPGSWYGIPSNPLWEVFDANSRFSRWRRLLHFFGLQSEPISPSPRVALNQIGSG